MESAVGQDQWTICAPVSEYTGLCFSYANRWLLQQSNSGMWILFESIGGKLDQGRAIAALTGSMTAERAMYIALTCFIQCKGKVDRILQMNSDASQHSSEV